MSEELRELHLEQFRSEGVDYDLEHPTERWRQLLADARYLGNSAFPRLTRHEKWGEWTIDDVLRYFGKIVDTLRTECYFPIMPPERDDPKWNTSYWQCYRLAKARGYIKTEPPKPEEVEEWERKRRQVLGLKESEELPKLPGLYLVPDHGEMIWSGEKSMIVKTRRFDLSEPHYLISGNRCYGIVTFKEPRRITKAEFVRLRPKHRITDQEAWAWWRLLPGADGKDVPLYAYEVKSFERFDPPKYVQIPRGIQTIIRPENIDFTEPSISVGDPGLLVKVEAEPMSGRIWVLGTRGMVERYSPLHYCHSAFLYERGDRTYLVDFGSIHPDLPLDPDYVLLTHAHPDHTCPELASFQCPVWGTQETLDILEERGWLPKTATTELSEDVRVCPVLHSVRCPTVAIRIGDVVFMPDFIGPKDRDQWAEFIKGAKVFLVDGSSPDRDLIRRRAGVSEPFGHASIKSILGQLPEDAAVLVVHLGNRSLELGDDGLLALIPEDRKVRIAFDGAVYSDDPERWDLSLEEAERPFSGEQRSMEVASKLAELGEMVWIPDFVVLTGSFLYGDHRPRDLDLILRAHEDRQRKLWYVPVDSAFMLKLNRAVQWATEEALGKAIEPSYPPPSPVGSNWPHIPVADLVLRFKRPKVVVPQEREFTREVVGRDFKEARLRTKRKDIERMAQQSLEEDAIKPGRFFMPLKPVRPPREPEERDTPERFVELFPEDAFPVYASVKRDGFRVQIHKDGDRVVIYSEDGNVLTDQLPSIVEAVRRLKPKTLVLDAEVERWENGVHLPREAAIAVAHSKEVDDQDLIANVFDCLYLDGRDLHNEPFEERWKALQSIGIDYSKETDLDPSKKLNIIPHIPCKDREALLKETERVRNVYSSEGNVAISHKAIYPLNGRPRDNEFAKFHNNVVVRGVVIEPVETKTEGVYNLVWGCLAGDHPILKKDETEVGPYERVLTIGSTFAAPYVRRGATIEVECETINYIVHEDLEGHPIELTAWAPRFMREVPGAKPDTVDEILRRAAKENHVLQIKRVMPDGSVRYEEPNRKVKASDDRPVCVLANGPSVEDEIAERFGTAGYAVFVFPDSRVESMDLSGSRSGLDVVERILAKRPTKVVVGSVGDTVRRALEDAGVEIELRRGRVLDGLRESKGLLAFMTSEPTLTADILPFDQAKFAVFFDPASLHFDAIDLRGVSHEGRLALVKDRMPSKVVAARSESLDLPLEVFRGRPLDFVRRAYPEAKLQESDPYLQYWDEDRVHRVCLQHHYRYALRDVLKECGLEELWPNPEPSEEEWVKFWPEWWPKVRKELERYFDEHPDYEHSPSCHLDLRFEVDQDVLVGWTVMDLMPDHPRVPPLCVFKREGKYSAEEFDEDPENWKIDYRTGEFPYRIKKGGAKAPVDLVARKKAQEPHEWLTYEGIQPPKSVGATRYGPGVFHLIRKLGEVEQGAQKPYMHEYFLTFPKDGDKPSFRWRLVFRYLRRPFAEAEEPLEEGEVFEAERIIPVSDEGWGEEAGWLCIKAVDPLPYVLSDRAVRLGWIPPYGHSCLPRYLRRQIPPEFQYWKKRDEEERRRLRDELVSALKTKKIRLKEAELKDFVLQTHYSDPAENIKRASPAHIHWDLRIDGETRKREGQIFHLVLEQNPLEVEQVSGFIKPCKGNEGGIDWMEVGKQGVVKFTKGPGTFEKNEPGYIKALDWGKVLVLEDGELFKKFQFRGKRMKGEWIMYRSDPDTDIWVFERSESIGDNEGRKAS